MKSDEIDKKIEEKIETANRLIVGIITLLIITGIIIYYITFTIPEISTQKSEKQNICKNLCKEKNMSYKTFTINQECLCTYTDEPLISYVIGIIQENNSIQEPEPLIFNRSDGTKYIMILNFTTQKIRIENVT